MILFSYLAHRRSCESKRRERQSCINCLAPTFRVPLTILDTQLLDLSAADIISSVQAGKVDPVHVLTAYSKKALKGHAATNCLTEVMISTAEVWARECNKQGPLAGMPVSLKDTVGVAGWDSCIGYSAWVGKPLVQDSALVKLLHDAGAVPFVKTSIPITLLSFEATSDVFGVTTNPHNKSYSPGGSTGGEAALLAYGGSRIGIGTDVAGSVRVPAHYSGVYTIKSSTQRFLKTGSGTSMAGQIGVEPVYSPMARTLEDLETFWRAVFSMKPWEYDHSCLQLPWRELDISNKKLKWGVMWDDGVVIPSPACHRALNIVVDALQEDGHQVISVNPPTPYEGLKVAAQLLLADAGKTAHKPFRAGETDDVGVRQAMLMFALPRWVKRIYVWYQRYVRRDEIYAGLVENWHEKTIEEYWILVAKREEYKRQWFAFWQEKELDFILCVPNALPAVPHGGMKEGFRSCLYSFLFNLLDYSAGVLPITKVDRGLDKLLPSFSARNRIEAGAYKSYDADKMHGLPVGIQVIGKRLEEEKVLEGMKIVERLMKQNGMEYELLRT